MSPVATSDAAFRGGACPTPEYTVTYTGNYTTSADASMQPAFFDQDFRCIIEALATLRCFAQKGVDGVGVAGTRPCSSPQVCFADGIADANEHGAFPSIRPQINANYSQ